ncbi:Uncharacterised protein [Yersinia frederiksenii]|nr:Uncharacterised protein [Yersinia frederiksenii]
MKTEDELYTELLEVAVRAAASAPSILIGSTNPATGERNDVKSIMIYALRNYQADGGSREKFVKCRDKAISFIEGVRENSGRRSNHPQM